MFQLGKDLFNGVEVWTVRRQEEKPCAGGPDCRPDRIALVAPEIVHDYDVTWPECRQQELFDVTQEARPVDGAIEDTRCRDAVMAKGGEEGQGFPVSVGYKCPEALAFFAPAAQRSHVGFGPCLVDEDQAAGINPVLVPAPPIPAPRHVRPCLLSPMNRFF